VQGAVDAVEKEAALVRQAIIQRTLTATQKRNEHLAGQGKGARGKSEGGQRGVLSRPGPAGTWYVRFFHAQAAEREAEPARTRKEEDAKQVEEEECGPFPCMGNGESRALIYARVPSLSRHGPSKHSRAHAAAGQPVPL
jgi:hypothetical protein